MSTEEKFDAIVVGAGPAGTAAAITLAKAGLQVALLEKGDFAGSKNVMGGILYRQPTEKIIPEFWKEAPLERHIDQQSIWLTSRDSAFQIGFKSARFGKAPYNCFSVLRAPFDRWFASKAEESGAMLLTGALVTEVLKQQEKVVGVKTDLEDGTLYADVVVIAEGVNTLLTEQVKLRKKKPEPHEMALAVKEVLSLPREKIEDRFQLEPEQGATVELFGEVVMGMFGMGWIYTNKESLSIGIGVTLSDLRRNKTNPNDILEHMKKHPAVKRLIDGAKLEEYLAHMIPEGGYKHIPRLYADGVLVVGDAAMLVNPVRREGSNLAMISGKCAGEAILEAKNKNDFSAAALSRYQHLLEQTFVIKDLKKYRRVSDYFEHNKFFLSQFPDLLAHAAYEYFNVDSVPKKEKDKKIKRLFLNRKILPTLIKQGYKACRAMGIP